jgi:protein TonB
MDRHFIAPATIAAALHAGLLFGIGSSKDGIKVTPTKICGDLITCVFPVDLMPPPEVENERVVAARDGGPSHPSLDEPPPIDSSTHFKIPVERNVINVRELHVDKIPMAVGVPGGEGDRLAFDGDKIFKRGELDNTPRARVTAAPAYPFEARRNGLAGEVVVEFVVDEAGNVHAPTVARSSDRVFEEAALRAVARWKFEPGKRDGRAVRFRMALPIQFTLNGE